MRVLQQVLTRWLALVAAATSLWLVDRILSHPALFDPGAFWTGSFGDTLARLASLVWPVPVVIGLTLVTLGALWFALLRGWETLTGHEAMAVGGLLAGAVYATVRYTDATDMLPGVPAL